MSTLEERRTTAMTGVPEANGFATRVVLQPIAAPSILGLYAFAGATFVVAAHIAGWYGNDQSAMYLFPFAAMFGGLAQFLAGMWSYRARDGLATAMHGTWGSFWLAYGVLNLLFATGQLQEPKPFHELGFWFIALAAITLAGTAAAFLEGGFGITAVLGTLTLGSTIFAIALLDGSSGLEKTAGWIFLVSAVCAWYMASAMMLAGAAGRIVLPLWKRDRALDHPGGRPTRAIELEWGEPGVKHGQ
jgi:uncharacterized protein